MADYIKELIAEVINIGKTSNKGKPVPEYMVAMITALETKLGDHTDKKIDELSEKNANELLVHLGIISTEARLSSFCSVENLAVIQVCESN